MFSTRDHFYPQFEKFIDEIASCDLILDLGSYYAFRKELARFRRRLERSRYYVMDYRVTGRKGNLPDVDGDICALPFRSESVDAVLCKDVLEHVKEPHTAVSEMHRILKKNGLLYCSVPFLHPYHGSKKLGIPDYWRFTHEGLDLLFSSFESRQIERAGGAVFVLRAFTPPWLARLLFAAPLMPLANAVDRLSLRRYATNELMVLAKK
jgi:SAM-dependent methyltransferase